MMTFQIYGKIKNVPNHQPEINCTKFDCFKLVNNQWQSTSSIFRYLNHPKFALLSQVFPLKFSDFFSICSSFLHHCSIILPYPICSVVLEYLPTLARTTSPTDVGKYTSTMEHMGRMSCTMNTYIYIYIFRYIQII